MGIVNGEESAVAQEAVRNVNGGRLAGVPRILLERKPEDGDLLARHGVEHGGDHALRTGIEEGGRKGGEEKEEEVELCPCGALGRQRGSEGEGWEGEVQL